MPKMVRTVRMAGVSAARRCGIGADQWRQKRCRSRNCHPRRSPALNRRRRTWSAGSASVTAPVWRDSSLCGRVEVVERLRLDRDVHDAPDPGADPDRDRDEQPDAERGEREEEVYRCDGEPGPEL